MSDEEVLILDRSCDVLTSRRRTTYIGLSMRRLRVALTLIVVLTSVIALFVGNHWRKLDADARLVPLTMAQRPEPQPDRSASAPERDEQLSPPKKALAFLILMLKEGHYAR